MEGIHFVVIVKWKELPAAFVIFKGAVIVKAAVTAVALTFYLGPLLPSTSVPLPYLERFLPSFHRVVCTLRGVPTTHPFEDLAFSHTEFGKPPTAASKAEASPQMDCRPRA